MREGFGSRELVQRVRKGGSPGLSDGGLGEAWRARLDAARLDGDWPDSVR